MNILIYGAGYVGIANLYNLARHTNIYITDIDDSKIIKLTQKINPIDNKKIFLNYETINYLKINFDNFDLFILALPTDLNKNNILDTSIIEEEIIKIRKSSTKDILIRSTLDIGTTRKLNNKFKNISYMPEFLTEAKYKTFEKNSFASVLGTDYLSKNLKKFINIYNNINNKSIKILKSPEAEIFKLANNTLLASRIAILNELESIAYKEEIQFEKIRTLLKSNPIIGNKYFKTSIGFGGYCLPKDSQALAKYAKPNSILRQIYKSNTVRKKSILKRILDSEIKEIYFDGLGFNFGKGRLNNSNRLELAKKLANKGIQVYTKLYPEQEKIVWKNIYYSKPKTKIERLEKFYR